ncbi:MAG: MFS transporter, partial [Acidisphaera sp.]|nr:MFS transporter [Acidisphaera sp.]
MSASLAPTSTRTARHPWLTLATVAAAQFMLVLDAFIVNVAIPSIRAGLRAGSAEMDAVITIYMIAYATLLIIGGRLGDIHGRKPVFILGVALFVASSAWCGLARSGMELILARLFQGASAALVSPQVLATIHTLFSDAKDRAKAFAVFGMTLGVAGGAGYVLGGCLIALNAGGLGWRAVFLVNLPIGAAVAVAATILMPSAPKRSGIRLDLVGAAMLFLGLMCLAVPILAAGDLGWPLWLLPLVLLGAGLIAAFPRVEAWVTARGRAPLIDADLLTDRALRRGLAAVGLLFAGNLSFYLVLMLFLQNGRHLAPFQAGLAMLPLVLAFVLGSRHGARAVLKHGAAALVRGALVMSLGTAACFGAIAAAP